MDIFTILFYQPIYNLVVVLYRAFGGDLGLAIIAIAVISRAVTIPITRRQIKMAEQNKEMNEKMKEIKQKHKNDQEKQNQEMAALSAEYLPRQVAGCLPFLIQMVFLISIYQVVDSLINSPLKFNEVAYSFVQGFLEGQPINKAFLGIIDLGQSPAGIGYNSLLAVAPYIVLAILVVITQYFSMKVMTGRNKKKTEDIQNSEGKSPKGKKKHVADDPRDDMAEAMEQATRQTMLIFPFMIGFMSLNFAAGLSLYWTVQSGFVIIQQLFTDYLSKRNQSK